MSNPKNVLENTAALPVVVLVGRPNVGKSTLFNRICQKRRALTSPIAGTTRDWIEGLAYWDKYAFRVVDTGGYAPGEDDVLTAVRAQVEHWVSTADAVIWVVDAAEGFTPEDQSVGRWLRKRARRVMVAVNKADEARYDALAAEFYKTGFPAVVALSALHGRRVGVLLEQLEPFLPPPAPAEDEGKGAEARVALVGRPNVGKSSLMNQLLGEARMIVSSVPGTTRDTIDTRIEWEGKKFVFMDTAGLRTKKSKAVGLEGLTRLMSERALDRCEVAVLLLDAAEGLLEGDVAVARLIEEKNRACVLGVNKWDLVPEKTRAASWFKDHQPEDMPFMAYAPMAFLSAKTGQNVPLLLQEIWEVHQQFHRAFNQDDLESFFWTQIQERPYTHEGRKLIFRSAEQVASGPPVIVVRSNMDEDDIHFSYQRRLENLFREQFKVKGTPVVMRFRRKK